MDGLIINTYIFILSTWLLLFLIFTGFGLFIRRSFGLITIDAESLLLSFWMGWAFTIFFLQIWNLFFKVSYVSIILVSIFGLAGIFWNYRSLWYFLKKSFSKNWVFYLILFFVAYWLAHRAILPLSNSDSVYHLSSVVWARSFPVVPGLGNLYDRLAYNSSFFLYAAMLDVGPWFQKSHHFANGILMLMLFAQILLSCWRLYRGSNNLRLYHIFTIFFLAPALTYSWIFNVSSSSPDLSIIVLGIILAVQLLAFLENSKRNYKESSYNIFFIVTIAMVGITVKLSFSVLGVVSVLIVFIVWLFKKSGQHIYNKKKLLIWVIIIASISLIPWMIRGVILSGYIAYPVPIGLFPVEWRLPYEDVVNMANVIKAWARAPGPGYMRALNNWTWLKPWAIRTFSSFSVAMPLVITFFSCFTALFYRLSRKHKKDRRNIIWLFLLPPALSLIYWFIAAPDPRFAGSSFWILGAGAVIIAISSFIKYRKAAKLIIILFFSISLLCNWKYVPVDGEKDFVKVIVEEKNISRAFEQLHMRKSWRLLLLEYWWKYVPVDGEKDFVKVIVEEKNISRAFEQLHFSKGNFQDFPNLKPEKFATRSGLVLYIPQGEWYEAWYTPLPSTTTPDLNLRLRQEGDMRYGFIIESTNKR